MSVENELAARGPLQATVRGVLIASLVIAVLVTAFSLISGIARVRDDVVNGTVSATLVTDTPVPGTGGDLVSGVYESAAVVVQNATGPTSALVLGGTGAGMLARLAIGAALIAMLVAVRRRAPFSRSTALQVVVAGGIAAIASVAQIGASVLGDWMLADQLDPSASRRWPIEAAFDPTPIAIGFGLMVVGLFLSHGAELQRETAGLV